MPLSLKAPAKINLGLRIIGRRPDGFHDIHSIFQTVGLFDELCIETAHSPSFACDNPAIPADESNLVLRALRLIEHEIGRTGNLGISLMKRIPTGAGLGGGSADAAAALKGIDTVLETGIPDGRLKEMAAELGSDIPFLIDGGTAVVSGRGEHIQPCAWPFDFSYVIVFPGFGVSTAWAYKNLKGYPGDDGVYETMTRSLANGDLTRDVFFAALVNDFEPLVFTEYPELRTIRDRLLDLGAAQALMTGSGASILGIFEDDGAAHSCADTMRAAYRDVFTVSAT